jgi:glycosyltransferase involved in cell wall biosynthesis
MNILHIVQSFHRTGRSRMIGDLIRGLEPLGVGSAAVSLTDADTALQSDLDLTCFRRADGFDIGVTMKLIRHARRRGAHVLHTHGRGAVPYAALARAFWPSLRWVHTVHRSDGDAVAAKPMLRRLLLRGVDTVVGVSEAALNEFARCNGSRIRRRKVIHNGIDLARFTAPRKVNALSPLIGMVASASGDKDHETLLQAFAEILKALPAARLAIAGEGPRAVELVRRAGALGVTKSVEFMGFRENVPDLLATFDVFVLASRTEGLGIAILEAMAAGVPVVASAVGGIPEIVRDGATGQLFPAGDVAGLRDAVLKALREREWSARLAAAAAAMVRERFSNQRMCEQYREVYAAA